MSSIVETEHGLARAFWNLVRRPVPPEHTEALFFGWVILGLFLLQVLTGILLSIYFEPSPAAVAESVQFIMRDVGWGWLVRGVHNWAAQVLMLVVALYLVLLLVRGRYRGAGAPGWYVGVLVLFLAAFLTYTGELLAWDHERYWRVTSALQGLESLGALGDLLTHVVRGGDEVTATTLSRTYTAHGMFLPWLVFVLLVTNLWLVARRIHGWIGGAR
jgi:cytochrome b6